MICKICGESGHFTQVLRAASWKTSRWIF
jgi:hypothetical protein